MESHLKWPDYLILVGFLVISLAIGIYHSLTGGRQRTTSEFIMANRRLKVIPTALSMIVSYQSAILLLGMTAEMYSYGAQYSAYSCVCIALAVIFVERIIVPWLYPLKLISIFDYLEKRFMSKSIRVFAASIGILVGVLYMGVAMYAPSAALESATGLPLSVSIPVMAAVSVSYTALGGMRAVIWTDVFQFITMIAGMIAISIKGVMLVGGMSNVFKLAGEEGRLNLTNFSVDPRERHTSWNLVIGIAILWINSYGLSQAAVQRYCAVETMSKARITMLIIIPPAIIMDALAGIIGLIVLAYYSSIKCDPLANGEITNLNQLLPYFVVTIFADSPGFSGLFLSTLYGGALSTVSSALSGSAANCWEDILKWKLSHLSESRKALINRLLVVLFGALSTGVAFLSAYFPGPITQVMMALCSAVTGPVTAIFILGAISKHANWKGTLFGGIVAVLITLWLSLGSLTVPHKHPPLPPVSMEQCLDGNGNSTLRPSSSSYVNYTSFEVYDGIGAKANWNETSEALPKPEGQNQLRGLENFYAISYLWFSPFGAMITIVVGLIASLITRDKDQEAKVDDRLLLRFNGCRWTGQKDSKEDMDDEKKASLQETKGLNGAGNGFLKDVEMMASNGKENASHRELNGNTKKDMENGFLKKDEEDEEETSHL